MGEVAEETAKFADHFNKFFDCLNVSNPIVGKKSRNTFKNPYRKSKEEDFRLKVNHINCMCILVFNLYIVLCSGLKK